MNRRNISPSVLATVIDRDQMTYPALFSVHGLSADPADAAEGLMQFEFPNNLVGGIFEPKLEGSLPRPRCMPATSGASPTLARVGAVPPGCDAINGSATFLADPLGPLADPGSVGSVITLPKGLDFRGNLHRQIMNRRSALSDE